jgi:type I restriction enzyme S subunit
VSRLNPRKATICRAAPHHELLTLASTEFVALKPIQGDIRFLEYIVSSELFRQRLDSLVQSVTRSHQRARPEEIYRFWSAWPNHAEQRAIADFLDRETAQIDTLVAKKRTLIERLKEKRTALISRTVTRGLPPDAARAAGLDPHPKLKPTGIDWLGDVPEHWEVTKGRFLGTLLGSIAITDEDVTQDDDGSPYAKVDDLNYVGSNLLLKTTKLSVSGSAPRHKRMLLFPKRGAAIFTNKVVIADGPYLFDSNLMGWEISRRANLKFVAYCLIARRLDDLADVSTVPQINNKHINPAHFPRPPLLEQEAIADFLDRETARIDGMVAKVESAIERLQEYRTALITAAVTGKIDVRGAAA